MQGVGIPTMSMSSLASQNGIHPSCIIRIETCVFLCSSAFQINILQPVSSQKASWMELSNDIALWTTMTFWSTTFFQTMHTQFQGNMWVGGILDRHLMSPQFLWRQRDLLGVAEIRDLVARWLKCFRVNSTKRFATWTKFNWSGEVAGLWGIGSCPAPKG